MIEDGMGEGRDEGVIEDGVEECRDEGVGEGRG